MKRAGITGIAALSLMLVGACSSSSDSEPATISAPVADSDAPAPETTPAGELEGGAAPYKLAIAEDGSTIRFDSCSGPIRILVNPGDLQEAADPYTDVDVAAQLGELFTQYAEEVSEASGLEVVYGGTTDQALDPALSDEQVIIFNFGSVGFPGREDEYVDEVAIFGAAKDGWTQILSFQHFENSEGFSIHYEEAAKLAGGSRDAGIDEAGKRWLKTALGRALGLQELTEEDMVAAGIAPAEHGAQIMYTDSHQEQNGTYNLMWGEGDKAGLAALGASNACF